jgi:hypothetical protein
MFLARSGESGEDLQLGSPSPTDLVPEFQTRLVFAINPRMGFFYALSRCPGQALFNEFATNSSMTRVGDNGQMVQIRATAIMSAEYGANQTPIAPHHDAQTGIMCKIGSSAFARIGVTQTDACSALPETENFVVIGHRHLGKDGRRVEHSIHPEREKWTGTRGRTGRNARPRARRSPIRRTASGVCGRRRLIRRARSRLRPIALRAGSIDCTWRAVRNGPTIRS